MAMAISNRTLHTYPNEFKLKVAVCINLLDTNLNYYIGNTQHIYVRIRNRYSRSIDGQNWYRVFANSTKKCAPNLCYCSFFGYLILFSRRERRNCSALFTHRLKKGSIWNGGLSLLYLRSQWVRTRKCVCVCECFRPNFHWNAEAKVVRDTNKYVHA